MLLKKLKKQKLSVTGRRMPSEYKTEKLKNVKNIVRKSAKTRLLYLFLVVLGDVKSLTT